MKRVSTFSTQLVKRNHASSLVLDNGAQIAVMGGGPAGSLFAYFLLDLSKRAGMDFHVDIYEPRDFSLTGPPGCNMCAGILSESLIQMLAVDGINLPPTVVQRGMDTYALHTEVGKAGLSAPDLEKRIGAVYRGAGPLGTKDHQWSSFDKFLLEKSMDKGANLIRARIEEVSRVESFPQVKPRGGQSRRYDFLAVATGVNTNALRMFPPLKTGFQPPGTMQTYIREYFVGEEKIENHMGRHTIHFFLLDQPGLDFAAIVPKGNFVTVALLGKDLNKEKVDDFLKSKEVRACMPPGWAFDAFNCHCSPRINITGAVHPYADRMVFLGDSGISRLYKDGIGAAYRAAKYAATTAIFHGTGEADLRRHYWLATRSMETDNRIGKLIFYLISYLKPRRFAMCSVLRMVSAEQAKQTNSRHMSNILWDIFTGSASYRDIFFRFFHPAFWSVYLWNAGYSLLTGGQHVSRRFRKGLYGR